MRAPDGVDVKGIDHAHQEERSQHIRTHHVTETVRRCSVPERWALVFWGPENTVLL